MGIFGISVGREQNMLGEVQNSKNILFLEKVGACI